MANANLVLSVNAAGALKSLKNVEGALGRVDNKADKTKKRFGKGIFGGIGKGAKKALGFLKGPAGLIAGLGAVVGVGTSISSIKDKFDMADTLAKNARAANISVEALGELRYMSGQMGVDAGALDGALKKMNRRLGEMASTGKGAAVNALKTLGITQEDLNTKFKTGEERFDAVVAALMKIEDPSVRAKAAFDTMGTAGQDLIMQMDGSTESMEKLRKEAHEVGAVMSTSFAVSAEKINDKFDKLGKSFGSIGIQIAEKLLPKLEPLIDVLLKNAPAIVDGVVKAFSGFMSIVEGLAPIISAIWPIFKALFDVIKFGWDLAKPAIAAMAPAIKTMADIIATAITGIPDAVKSFTDWITNLPSFISDKIDQVVNFFSALPGRVIAYFMEMKDGMIAEVMAMLDWMPNWVKEQLGITEDAFKGTADRLVNNSIVPNMIGDIKKEFMKLSDIVAPVDIATNLVTKGFDDLTAKVIPAGNMNLPRAGVGAGVGAGAQGMPIFNFHIGRVIAGDSNAVTQDDLRRLSAGILREANTAMLRQRRIGGVLNG
jgi:hypothetical protein